MGILEIDISKHADIAASVIRRAFATVAEEYGLTPENAPASRAFQTEADLIEKLNRADCFCFGMYLNRQLIGFIALQPEYKGNGVELTRLAILPEYRHCGYGTMLVDIVVQKARELGESRVVIGVNDYDKRLKNWYKSYGFAEIATKEFEHIPFAACYMELNLSPLN